MPDLYKIAISKYIVESKLLPGDPRWQKFNSGFNNRELDIVRIAEAVNKGQAITTQHKDHWRATQNYLCGQHIGLDLDSGDINSSIEHLKQDKFVSRYGAFIYSTISHTEEHPRSRVIFLLDTPIMQAKNYTLAATALLWLFGTADRQCKDAVRFFYGSKNCELELLGNILPLETIQHIIAEYRETGCQEKHRAARSDYHAPASQKEVSDALALIPPWQIPYDEWVEILMGIHSQFGEEGYSLAANWGDGKDGEIEQKWHSFKADGNVTGTVTVATVFGIAKRFGWKKYND